MTQRFFITRLISLSLVVLAALTGVRQSAADEASSALSKYREPVDHSVDRALKWLAQNQKDDGSFPGRHGQTTAVAALAGMAYLSKGYTPGLGPYGQHINKCLDYVIKHEQEKDGKPNGYLVRSGEGKMYAHCISTLFLSEVSGMVDPARQQKIDDVMPRALELIIKAQEVKKNPQRQGGWRYEPHTTDSDLSLTGWAVMALRSARLNGAAVPDKTVEEAIKFIMNCHTDRDRRKGGKEDREKSKAVHGFAYQPGQGAKPAMTGVAVLCLILCGQHEHEVLPEAGEYLLGHPPDKGLGSHRHYAMYYCSQAMFQLGGKYWDEWAGSMYDHLLKHQKDDGSWGDAYQTVMTILSMTVSYRQLPVYQR